MVRVMSDRGFDLSTGSACAAGKKNKSRTLETMGVSNEDAFSAIRISTGPQTRIEEIDLFCDALEKESTILKKSL
jgi:cysteine desulfurase